MTDVLIGVEAPAFEARSREFELLARALEPRLLRIASRVLGDRRDAEDAVQEAMERTWQSWDDVRDESKRSAWVARICLNRSLSLRRRLSRRRLDSIEIAPGREVDFGEDRLDVDRAYLRLSPRQRAVVTLHYGCGYTLDECAGVLGSRPGTVRSHLNRALATMRRELAPR